MRVLARLTIYVMDNAMASFQREFEKTFLASGAKDVTDKELTDLPWYHRVLRLLLLGDYKWYCRQHRESHRVYVSAMTHFPTPDHHDDPGQEAGNEEKKLEREIATFLDGIFHLREGMLTHHLEDITVDDARAHLQQAVELFRTCQNRSLLIKALVELAYLHFQERDSTTTWSLLEQVDLLFQNATETVLGPEEPSPLVRLQAASDLLKAALLFQHGRYYEALTIATHLHEMISEHPTLNDDPTYPWKVGFLLGAIHDQYSSATEVKATFTSMLERMHDRGLIEPILRAYFNLILASLVEGTVAEAVARFHELEQFLAFHEPTPVVELRLEWIKGYVALEGYHDPARALIPLHRALAISEELEDPLKIASIVALVIVALLELHDREEVRRYLLRLETLVQQLNEEDHNLARMLRSPPASSTDALANVTTLVRAQYFLACGLLAYQSHDHALARHFLEHALATYPKERLPLIHRYWKARTLHTYLYLRLEDSHASLTELEALVEEGVTLSQSLPNKVLEAQFLATWGEFLLHRHVVVTEDGDILWKHEHSDEDDDPTMIHDLSEALHAFQRAKSLLQYHAVNGDVTMVHHHVTDLLATTLEVLGHHEEAAAAWEDAWELYQELHAKQLPASLLAPSDRSTLDDTWWA